MANHGIPVPSGTKDKDVEYRNMWITYAMSDGLHKVLFQLWLLLLHERECMMIYFASCDVVLHHTKKLSLKRNEKSVGSFLFLNLTMR